MTTTHDDEETNDYISEHMQKVLNYSAEQYGFNPLYGEWYVRKDDIPAEPIHASFVLSRAGWMFTPATETCFKDGDSFEAVKKVLQSKRFRLIQDTCGLSPSEAWKLYTAGERTKDAVIDTDVELPVFG